MTGLKSSSQGGFLGERASAYNLPLFHRPVSWLHGWSCYGYCAHTNESPNLRSAPESRPLGEFRGLCIRSLSAVAWILPRLPALPRTSRRYSKCLLFGFVFSQSIGDVFSTKEPSEGRPRRAIPYDTPQTPQPSGMQTSMGDRGREFEIGQHVVRTFRDEVDPESPDSGVRPFVGTVVGFSDQFYRVKYDDDDKEDLTHDELRNAAISPERAAALRAGPPALGNIPSWNEIKKSTLKVSNAKGTCVTTAAASNRLGVVVGTNGGKTLACRYTVRFEDGSTRGFKNKELVVIGARVVKQKSLEGAATVTLTGCSSGALGVSLNGRASILTRGIGDWKIAPFGGGEGHTVRYSKAKLIASIRSGEVTWFDPPRVEAGQDPRHQTDSVAASSSYTSDVNNPDAIWTSTVQDPSDGESESDEESDVNATSTKSGASDTMHSVDDPYTRRRILEELCLWPSIYRGAIASSNAKETPGEGFWFEKGGDALAANSGGGRQIDIDRYRAPSKFGIFDPFVQYPSKCPSLTSLKCPHCNQSAKSIGKMWSKGWSCGGKRCFSLTECYPIVARRIRHMGCPESKENSGERDFTVLHQGVTAEFSSALRGAMPVHVGSVLFDKPLVDLIVESKAGGLSLSAIHGMVRRMYTICHARKWMSYLVDLNERSTGTVEGVFSQRPPLFFGNFGDHGERAPSLSKIRKCYLADCERRRETMLKYISSLKGEGLCSDHTFWAAKHVRVEHKKLYSALFAIMNEYGQVESRVRFCPKCQNAMNSLA